ncbi:MAG: phosphate signaling complex protein PhoU [Gemmatimonadaceae bacterium]
MTVSMQNPGPRHFHEQLAELKRKLLEMSGNAERLVELSIDALLEGDRAMAEEVIAGDKALNTLEIEVEQLAVSLLALQQPMARDLRFLVATIKASSDLERVGDHAVNIAESAIRIADHGGKVAATPELEDMARRARQMLSNALDAFTRNDGALGREVCKADDAVDSLHESVFRILLTHMMEDARTIGNSLEMLLVSRNLERVADLATNIAEDAVYVAEGRQIKHHFED